MNTFEDQKQLVSDLMLKKERYYNTLKPIFNKMLERWKVYIGEAPPNADPRDAEKEEWRSYVNVPKATANTDAVAATVTNIITSSSPIIQAVRANDLNVDLAEYAEKLIAYTFRGNKLRSRIIPPLVRSAEIQGMQPVKVQWQDRSRSVYSQPSLVEMESFWNEVSIVSTQLGLSIPDARTDPNAFEVWMDMVRTAGHPVPEMPKASYRSKSAYIGPWFSLPAFWNLFYNPFIVDPQEQEVIFERTIVPASYLKALSGDDGPYNPECVEYGLTHSVGSRYTEEEQAFYEYVGYSPSDLDGGVEPFGEVIEAYMPTHPEIQFAAILNRTVIINNDWSNPLPSGDMPYTFVHRKRSSHASIGYSPYVHNKTMLEELSAIRSSRLDAVSLTAVPAFNSKGGKLAGGNTIQNYQPGKIYHNEDIDQIKITVPDALFRESNDTEVMIDQGWGVGGNVRGQQATQGRVPLGESQSRLTQATLPLIELAREVEDSLEITIPWIFNLFYEYADETTRVKLLNRLEPLDFAKINQILEMEFNFTGATQAGNRGELAQLILMWMKQFGDAFIPAEKRQLAIITATLFGIPDIKSAMQADNPLAVPPPTEPVGPDGVPVAPGQGPVAPQGAGPVMPGNPAVTAAVPPVQTR